MRNEVEIDDGLESTEPVEDDADLGDAGKMGGWIDSDPLP